MKKSVLISTMGVLAACGGVAQAQEVGRVISSTPITQQVAVPRQVCSTQPMAVQQPTTGGGAVLGGLAGGAIGNTIGGGSGRAAATVLGLVGGALLGNNIEANGQRGVQNVQQCSTQTTYENRTVAYNVRYEYAGREYSVQMPYDPGATVRLQVSPVGMNSAPPETAAAAGTVDQGTMAQYPQQYPPQPAVVAPAVVSSYPVYAAPAYPPPAYYPYYPSYYPWYPPVSLSLGFGFFGGGHHHGGRFR